MAVKDYQYVENKDLGESTPTAQKQQEELSEDKSKVVKNAHATGDGSYGRNDESLPDDQEPEAASSDNSY